MIIEEQENVLKNDKKNMLVSASAGSGKTYIMIKYITKLICEDQIPVKDLLVLTFTKAAANEMKERLLKTLREKDANEFVVEQIDALSTANISTIHSFCEKCIKKYANLLEISDNFQVLDENLAQKLRSNAFELVFKNFAYDEDEDYFTLISAFKNDKSKIRQIIFDIENLVNSVADKDEFMKKNTENCEELFDDASKFLVDNTKKMLQDTLEDCAKIYISFYDTLKNCLQPILNSADIVELANCAENFAFPFLPKRKDAGAEVVDALNVVKKNVVKIVDQIKDLRLVDEEVLAVEKSGTLEKIILKLYKNYEKIENNLKKAQNFLDFYDLEKFMKILSEKENLFSGLKFVVVDEYQDTNKVQERIIKNVAKNCNFVAVGDVKQGIYGFRLASSEIFLNDLKEFQADENSAVNFLQSNFRSSQKVLDFVNDVFSKCMTEETTGIDYQNGSMLEGRSEFADEGVTAVNIDVVAPKEKEIFEKSGVYSVKDAQCISENKHENLLLDIKRRIQECLSSKISVDGKLRQCTYSDIAILSRKRDDFFSQLEDFLQENSIPVISNSRSLLMDEPEMKVLLNILKIAKCADDDVALLSVLLSPFGNFSMGEVASEKIGNEKSLCEIVFDKNNKKFEKIREIIEKIKLFSQIYGIYETFLKIFAEINYYAYINSKPNHIKLNTFLEKFLAEILSSGFDFDLANLIKYFETVDIVISPEPTAVDDAVLLTTIHNSKGLEYPIVFLIGCDQNLKKGGFKSEIEINERFGLAVKFYDENSNSEIVSAKMTAIKQLESEKDFVEELMIFYVALTRAKNRLYLFGEQKIDGEGFDKFAISQCDTYFDLIFFALKNQANKFFNDLAFESENLSIIYIEEIEQKKIKKLQEFVDTQIDENLLNGLKKYLEFSYPLDNKKNFHLKESVTSINLKNAEEKLEKFSNENFSFASNMVEIGNAYHLALKVLDFDKISTLDDLKTALEQSEELVEAKKLIDVKILFENIKILKEITSGATKIFKEHEFVMKERVDNIFEDCGVHDEILVQGVVDLFVTKGDEILLVDYKYSNSTNDDYLREKYFYQLKTYKLALTKALNKKVSQAFLLSLKNHKLIKIEI